MECYYLDKHCHDSHRNAKANLINCWYMCCWRITAIKILYGRRHDWKPFMNSDVEVDPACYNLSWHRLRSDKNPKKVALISNYICMSSCCGYRKIPGSTCSPNDEITLSAFSLVTNEGLFLLTAGWWQGCDGSVLT